MVRRGAQEVWRPVPTLVDYALLGIAWLRRGRKAVIVTHAGSRALASGAQAAVFVHYDRRGEVHDYVMYYLEALRAAEFEILFVSNGGKLAPASLERVRPLCAGVMIRRNIGYDFGAYRDGLRALGDLSRFRRVLLANDSVYGPLFDLRNALSQCDDSAAIWGMTDSWSARYHLQSFFLLFNHAALVAPRFKQFWDEMLLLPKSAVIRFYELRFTQLMLRQGLRCAAVFPYRRAAEHLARAGNAGTFADETLSPRVQSFFEDLFRGVEEGATFNALHHFWDHMISELRCPFIKRELLSRNPANIPHAYLWERLIRSVSTYDTEMIARHLQITTRDRAP